MNRLLPAADGTAPRAAVVGVLAAACCLIALVWPRAARACFLCNAMVREQTVFTLAEGDAAAPIGLSASSSGPMDVTGASAAASGTSLTQVTSGTGNLNGFNINIVAGSGLAANSAALAAFDRAAAQWEQYISNPITVTINANLGTFSDNNIIGGTSNFLVSGSYTSIRSAVVSAAAGEAGDAIVSFLPTAAQFSMNLPAGVTWNGNVVATKANLKATGGFGNLDAQFGATDASITFNQAYSFDYDNSDGVGAGLKDFETVAAHEIGHALGFFSSVDDLAAGVTTFAPSVLDLFRFSGTTGPTTTAQFSSAARELRPGIDAVTSDVANSWRMSTGTATGGDGRQASHWKADELTGVNIGIMDPTLSSGNVTLVQIPDLRALDLIGYNINTSIPEPASGVMFLAGLSLAGASCGRRNRLRSGRQRQRSAGPCEPAASAQAAWVKRTGRRAGPWT
jgi:hypothetical protein